MLNKIPDSDSNLFINPIIVVITNYLSLLVPTISYKE